MFSDKEYIKINRQAWDTRALIHVKSDFYHHQDFLKGNTSLNDIELNLLGDISGLDILHLQCHFGQDTISLARMGAKVTGVDFSEKAIEIARKTAKQTNSEAEFICCNLYDLPQHLNKTFDMVFTTYGTIVWLPDIERWAQIVSKYLKPGGKFIFVEFHPFVLMFDDQFKQIIYPYSSKNAIIETEKGTYADKNAKVNLQSVTWNHSVSETMNSLINNNIEINKIEEYNYSPYNSFNNTIEVAEGKFMIQSLENKIPMVYSIVGTKK